jgi:hypothetical protein
MQAFLEKTLGRMPCSYLNKAGTQRNRGIRAIEVTHSSKCMEQKLHKFTHQLPLK